MHNADGREMKGWRAPTAVQIEATYGDEEHSVLSRGSEDVLQSLMIA